ncbi:unnamed protein product [Cylicocyclus nassatus]|uniref:C2H2-type domain-containing protein n=1 Tax=Cylicocyclus nassatus TaxID=53992 RepID=A0AA36HFR0_CYLNA|nr:unnamed protein product [Cylicocyclus nassatus]
MITKAQCHICRGGPFVLKTLYNHLREHLGCTEDVINEVKSSTKKAIHCGKKEFGCEACPQVFYSAEGLRKHKKLKHSISGTPEEIKSPVCPEKTKSLQNLALHSAEHHGSEDASFELIDKTFHSWEDFEGDDVQMANDLFKAVLFEVNEAKFESYLYACMSFLASIDAQDMINVNSHCERYGVCSYQFQCSCSEAYKAGVSCVHLHAVATFVEEASALHRPIRHYLASSETPLLRESENDDNCEAGSEGTGTMPPESIDIADEGANENEEPRDILEEDRTKQTYQLVEGRISDLSELMRCCRREGQYEVLEECANAL